VSVTYKLDGDLLEVVVEGDHEVEDFIRVVNAAIADPAWPGSAWLLLDVRSSPAVTRRTAQEIRATVDFLSESPGRFRYCVAVLVSSTMQQEVSRVGQAMAEFHGSEITSFYDRDAAIAWLRERPVAQSS
jgi:hypothetical protein